MKWFTCVNNGEYLPDVCVAVKSCPPDLEPICVIDYTRLTTHLPWERWLRDNGVTII
jgi:hypothetical protein